VPITRANKELSSRRPVVFSGGWPCQTDVTAMENMGIFPFSTHGQRNGRRASTLSGQPPLFYPGSREEGFSQNKTRISTFFGGYCFLATLRRYRRHIFPAKGVISHSWSIAMTTTNEIADKIANEHNITKTQAKALVEAVFKNISDAASKDEETSIPGFGKFKVKESPEREGRNPSTGQTIKIAASKKLSFTAAKALKDSLNG
jgi:DNA-binding protein HU-beta